MKLKQIKALVKLMETTGLNVIEISEGEEKIRLEKKSHDESWNTAALQPESHNRTQAGEKAEASGKDKLHPVKEVKSPMVGVFYAAPAPDAEPFVTVGSQVKKGDVLCVIEAMKLMNEICAETDGEIVKLCAENGQVVEYGQTILEISKGA